MLWYVSDYHFAHSREFIYGARGFSSAEEHDDAIVNRHNALVSRDDTTVFLGDFCFDKRRFFEFLVRLNGKFVFILGNHDDDFRKFLKEVQTTDKYFAIKGKVVDVVDGFLNTSIAGHPATVCHFAMKSWNKSHFNAWHLYGHHHYPTAFGGKSLNVAVDCHECKPWSEAEVAKFMDTAPNNWDFIEKREDRDEKKAKE